MSMGLYWLRAGARRRGIWYYVAWALLLLPFAGWAYVMAFLPAFRSPLNVAVTLIGLALTLFLLRAYLPWWPRSATERVLDRLLPAPRESGLPLPAVESQPGVFEAANPLTDPYDAASGTGRWAISEKKAVGQVRFRIDPDPAPGRLNRATRAALKAARRELRSGERVRITAALRRAPGPDLVTIGFVIRGPAPTHEHARSVGEALEAGFRRAMAPGYVVARIR